jgi:hypothetical protein
MDIFNFEKKLKEMTKPEVSQLKHEDLLSKTLINAKDRSVVSWWWLSIPLYLIMMFMMKSTYYPGTTLISGIHDMAAKQRFLAVAIFVIVPIVFILINFFTIKKVYYLSGSPTTTNFLKIIWSNLVMIFFAILILIIYSL